MRSLRRQRVEYNHNQIATIMQLLEDITVSGTDNMKRIIFIRQILEQPKERENDGN